MHHYKCLAPLVTSSLQFCARSTASVHDSLSESRSFCHTQPHIALWRERPICRLIGDLAGPEANASLVLSWEQATVHFWPATFTVSDDDSLQHAHTAEATTRRCSIFYFAVRHTRRHDHLLTTPIQLILDACSPFWSWLGHDTPPDREWERERSFCTVFYHWLLRCLLESREREKSVTMAESNNSYYWLAVFLVHMTSHVRTRSQSLKLNCCQSNPQFQCNLHKTASYH